MKLNYDSYVLEIVFSGDFPFFLCFLLMVRESDKGKFIYYAMMYLALLDPLNQTAS